MYRHSRNTTSLIAIAWAKEDLDREPSVPTNFEPIWQTAQGLHLFVRQAPTIKLEVGLNPRWCDRLGNDAGASLQTPLEKYLSCGLPLFVCDLLQCLVLSQR